jgi:transposase
LETGNASTPHEHAQIEGSPATEVGVRSLTPPDRPGGGHQCWCNIRVRRAGDRRRWFDWPRIEPLSDDEIEQCLLPKASTGEPAIGSKRIQPDFTLMHRELRRKGVTLQLLWEEYVEAHAAARTYRYTQFCQLYKDWALTLKRSMRQQHRAGERLFADFADFAGHAGHAVPIVAADGDIAFQAHIFVAVLGASSYTFACATRSEGTVDWIGSIIESMEFFGGVPELLVPDNPRALIAQPDRYEPVLGQPLKTSSVTTAPPCCQHARVSRRTRRRSRSAYRSSSGGSWRVCVIIASSASQSSTKLSAN